MSSHGDARADGASGLEGLLADLPEVHELGEQWGGGIGVYATDTTCYEFLAKHAGPDVTSLETGLGLSTVIFAKSGASHTCVVHDQVEVDRLLAYCRPRDISTEKVRFAVGDSTAVLPTLDIPQLDLLFIDGGHGFPTPAIDWFFAAPYLREGGLLVVDDVTLPSVRLSITDYLDRDPRWTQAGGDWAWRAYRRASSGSLSEEWTSQRFLGPQDVRPAPPTGSLARRALRAVTPAPVRRAVRRIISRD